MLRKHLRSTFIPKNIKSHLFVCCSLFFFPFLFFFSFLFFSLRTPSCFHVCWVKNNQGRGRGIDIDRETEKERVRERKRRKKEVRCNVFVEKSNDLHTVTSCKPGHSELPTYSVRVKSFLFLGLALFRFANEPRGAGYSLRLAFDEMTGSVGAAMAVDGTLRVELFEALLVSCDTAVAPNLLALKIQSRADTVEAVTSVIRAWIPVFLINIRWTLTCFSGTNFRKIALVR